MKVVQLTIQNRAVAFLVAILVLGLGITFLTLGMALLAGVAIAGGVIGTGAAIYRRLRSKPDPHSGQRLGAGGRLDPSLEVRPDRAATIGPPKPPEN